MITLYSKDGQVKAEKIKKFSYSGKFMGECFLTANFASSDILNFDIGDYAMFRSEKFVLNYIPAKKKQASKGVYGKAFEYDNVKFNSLADELTRIEFIDVVKYDNNIAYSSQPTFSFYANSVHDLVDRIQANLDLEFKGDEKWAIVVSEDVVSTSKNISVSNISVADAVVLINTEFGLNFTFKNRTLTIGESGLAVGKVFAYGKDNGLFDIQQTTNQDAKIITRLRAFGSTRNIPRRYYNNLKDEQGEPYVLESDDIKNLMLPSFPYEESDPRKLYLDSDNIKKYGVRYGSVYFDSEENEIYPSIEGMTKKQLNLSNINVSLPKDDNGNLDEVLGADNPTDDGLIPDEGKGKIDGQFKIYLKDIGFDLTEKDKDGQYKYQIAGQSVQIAMKSGMCVGREFDVVENGIKKDASLGYTRYVLELKRFEDDQIKGGTAFPNNIYTIDKGDKFIILGIGMPDVYVKSASQKLLVAAQEYLSQNDETKYSYQPTISSNFMARNPHLGESIKEGDIFTFKDDDLQIDASEIIQTLNIEYNLDTSPLPTYKVVLSNDKIASRLDKMQNSINTLVSNGTGITINQVKSLINTIGASMFLRKDISDSTDYLLKFLDGIEIGDKYAITKDGKAVLSAIESLSADIKDLVATKVKTTDLEAIEADLEKATINDLVAQLAKIHNLSVTDTANILRAVVGSISSDTFKSGFGGEGFRIYEALNGDWNLEIDNVIVRKVFSVFELIVQKITHQGGMVINSPNGAKITKVTDGGSYWKCEHDSATDFFKDDQVLCQNFTGTNIKRYWRLATNAGKGYVNLSKTDQEANSAIPQEGDEIVVLGNRTNINRQSAIIVSTIGDNAPYTAYYSGINSYSLVGKETTRIGNLNGIVDKDFGALKGNGLFSENVYLKGIFRLTNGKTIEKEISDNTNSLTNSIQATKSELNASISKAEQTALLAQKSVDGLEIGGRNYLLNTDINIEKIIPWSEADYTLDDNILTIKPNNGARFAVGFPISKSIPIGEIITLTFDYSLNIKPVYDYIHITTNQADATGQISLGSFKKYDGSWDRLSIRFKVPDRSYKVLYIGWQSSNKEAVMKIRNKSVSVQTHKPTDWSPAPEDVQSQIAKSKEEAEVAAKAYADAQDNLKQIESKAYADDKVTEEEKRAIADAKAKLDAAKAYAKAQDEALKVKTDAYADGKITAEEKRAIADANAKLAAAKKYADAQDNLLKTQQEAYADGKVTESEKRAIADATNKVNAAKSELNASISKAEQTALLAQKSVDGLEIGGRNLWADSYNAFIGSPAFGITKITDDILGNGVDVIQPNGNWFSVYTYGYIGNLENNTDYIFSCYVYYIGDNPVAPDFFVNTAGYGYRRLKGELIANRWCQLYGEFKTSPTNKDDINVHFGFNGYDRVGKYYIQRFKIEKGNKPTDWTPAPEDQQAELKKEIKDVEQRFEIADGQINSHIKETTQLVTETKLANGESIKTLEQVKVQINDINVTAGNINTTLGEATKKQGEINSSISNLEQTAGSIKTSIEGFKETEKEIKDTATRIEATHQGIVLEASEKSAQKAIDELEIGGRNYLLNTDINIEKIIPWDKADYTLDDNILTIKPNNGVRFAVGFPISKSIPIGEIITLTFDYSLNIKPVYDYISITPNQVDATGQISLGSFKKYDGSWDRLSIRFKVPDRSYKVLYIGWQSSNKEAVMKIRNKSVSIQTHKPTDWSPAPEDYDAKFTETHASLKVLNDKIASEVSKTNGIRTDLTTLSQSHNGFKAQVKSDISGAIDSNNEVIKSSFEMKDNKIGLLGSEIDITGKVTFSALNSESQNKINTANSTASTALSNANNAQSSASSANSSLTSLKSSLGDLAYADKVEKAKLGSTIIEGGFIKTELIKTDELVSKKVKTANSGPRFEMEGSEMKVYGDGVHPNMIFGVNKDGYAVMEYYTPTGNKLYDLGPSGINMLNFAPVKWTEKKLNQFSTAKSRENIPWQDFYEIIDGNVTQTNSPIYYNYYAGGSPTVSQAEREREKYTYASINGPKIADGWYYTPPEVNNRGYERYQSNNSGRRVKPGAWGQGLYSDSNGVLNSNGVLDRDNIYIVDCYLYFGGVLTDYVNYYFQENPKK